MTNKPSVLFLSCCDTRPDDIIKLILNDSESSRKILIEDNIYGYPWVIDNKYYTAEINLCSLSHNKIMGSKKFAENVQAVVLLFDSLTKNFLDKIESYLPIINEYSPDIKILITKNVSDDSTVYTNCTKRKILEWCVLNDFELVELVPLNDEEKDDVEEDFPDTTGIKRIIQALNAHVWPNLVMKTSISHTLGLQKNLNHSHCVTDKLKKQLKFEKSLGEFLESDDFSDLFSQLSEIKAKVSSLSGSDRKEAAEQVVKAFWKALGGDDDEFVNI